MTGDQNAPLPTRRKFLLGVGAACLAPIAMKHLGLIEGPNIAADITYDVFAIPTKAGWDTVIVPWLGDKYRGYKMVKSAENTWTTEDGKTYMGSIRRDDHKTHIYRPGEKRWAPTPTAEWRLTAPKITTAVDYREPINRSADIPKEPQARHR